MGSKDGVLGGCRARYTITWCCEAFSHTVLYLLFPPFPRRFIFAGLPGVACLRDKGCLWMNEIPDMGYCQGEQGL